MKSSSVSDPALVAVASIAPQGGRGNGTRSHGQTRDTAAHTFLPRRVLLGTCLALMSGVALAATVAVFALSLLLAAGADFARWTLSAGSVLPAWDAARVLDLLADSGACGLIGAALACAFFCRDLVRQRWL